MTRSGRFSVIVPSYKMGKFIGAALKSVGAQTCTEWEIIIVDDCGPEDGTEGIIKSFAAKYPQNRIEFIRHEKNTGVSGARNTAIRAAQGEFLAFLDPDDMWKPTYLHRVMEAFEASAELDVLATAVESFRETEAGEISDRVMMTGWQIDRFPYSLVVGNFIQPSAVVVKSEALQVVGEFDETPELQHIEDYDLWIRLTQAGKKFQFINECLVRYRKHESAATSNTLQMHLLLERLTAKHTSFFMASNTIMTRHALNRIDRITESLKNPLKGICRIFLGRF